jgi:hypothetical protein
MRPKRPRRCPLLRPKPPQSSFHGSYLYDHIVHQDHLLRKINHVVDFSFVHDLIRDRHSPPDLRVML